MKKIIIFEIKRKGEFQKKRCNWNGKEFHKERGAHSKFWEHGKIQKKEKFA